MATNTFRIKKELIPESKELIAAALAGYKSVHVFGDGPVYKLKFDIWTFGKAWFENGEILIEVRNSRDELIKWLKRKYSKLEAK